MTLLTLTGWCSETLLSACRELHFAASDKGKIESGIRECTQAPSDAVILAYQGSFQARLAEFSINPYTKWNCFSEGRDLLEAAVTSAPENPEIRFIRLSVQLKAPSFLGYTSDIKNDTRRVVNALHTGWLVSDRAFRTKVIDFLLANADIDASTQKKLTQIKHTP